MNGNLYFIDRFSNKRLVSEKIDENNVGRAIKDYVLTLNPKFKIYYMRSWPTEDGKGMNYDVGSHVESFIWERGEEE